MRYISIFIIPTFCCFVIIIRYNLPHINSKYVYWCHFAFLSLEVFRYSFSYRFFSIALKVILHKWRIPHRLFKCPPLKVLLGFIIRMQFTCLVRSRSRWFSGYLIWLSRKARQRRKRKNNNILPSHHPLLLLIPISPLRPRTALLAANGFIVRCHVTSKKPMRTHANTEKNIQQTLQTV